MSACSSFAAQTLGRSKFSHVDLLFNLLCQMDVMLTTHINVLIYIYIYLYVYIYIYIHIYIYNIYIYIFTCICMCICTHLYILYKDFKLLQIRSHWDRICRSLVDSGHICICIYIHIHVHTHICIYAYACMHIYIYTYICICMYIYMYIYIHNREHHCIITKCVQSRDTLRVKSQDPGVGRQTISRISSHSCNLLFEFV